MQAGTKLQLREDSDEEMAGPDPYRKETVIGEGNEAYRVYDQPGDVPTASKPQAGYNPTRSEAGHPQAHLPECVFHFSSAVQFGVLSNRQQ